MSAFIVSDGTMDRVVAAVLMIRRKGEFDGLPAISENASEIGRRLYALNSEAVGQRYGETTENAEPHYVWEHIERSEPALYMSVRSLIYQCNEGDIPHRALFKELKMIADQLAERYITATKAYESAPWDVARADPRHLTA